MTTRRKKTQRRKTAHGPHMASNNPTMQTSPMPFLTTSQVVSKLNAVLAELDGGDTSHPSPLPALPRPVSSSSSSLSTSVTPNTTQNTRFELQRQGPHGFTRRVTPSESAALDCQQKIQQAAAWVGSLPHRRDQIEWAHQQRQHGNQQSHSVL